MAGETEPVSSSAEQPEASKSVNDSTSKEGSIETDPKHETEASSNDSTASKDSGATDKASMKIKKRALDGEPVNKSSFTLRSERTSATPPRAPASRSAAPPWAKKAKPAWAREEDFNKVMAPVSKPEPQPTPSSVPRSYTGTYGRGPTPTRDSYVPRPSQKDDAQIEEDIALKKRNLDHVVRQHYNKRTFVSRNQARHLSPIIKLRSFNNAIKYMIINNAVKPGDRVLDLGCGKGGDINKFTMARISEYLGIDISNASISEAINRYKHSRAAFEVTFVTGDCFGKPLPEVLRGFQHIKFPFDAVSMQFCMHYAFESEAKVRTLLENITRSLKIGGLFFGTIPSSDVIREKIKRLPPGTKSFGNSVYKVTFEKPPPPSGYFDSTYGNLYNYYLEDAIDDVPEYVVPFEAFRSLAQEYGLKLSYKKTFNEVFGENIRQWMPKLPPRILESLQRSDGNIGIQGDEAEATAFYLAFEFIKVD